MTILRILPHIRTSRVVYILLFAGAVAVSMACTTLTPQTAENPIGTTHTVTAHVIVDEELISILEQQANAQAEQLPISFFVSFEVTDGPNAGAHNEDPEDCSPSCVADQTEADVSWTYRSNGEAGTDTIRVCSLFAQTLEEQIAETEDIIEGVLNETVDEFLADLSDAANTNFTSLEDLFCDESTKTWVAPTATPQPAQRPNIGGALSGLLPSGQPTALPTAPAAVAPAANTVIRPPNTGDAGLR